MRHVSDVLCDTAMPSQLFFVTRWQRKRSAAGKQPYDPQTPDPHRVCSKRAFDGEVTCSMQFTADLMCKTHHLSRTLFEALWLLQKVRAWRRALHRWDDAIGEDEEVVDIKVTSWFIMCCFYMFLDVSQMLITTLSMWHARLLREATYDTSVIASNFLLQQGQHSCQYRMVGTAGSPHPEQQPCSASQALLSSQLAECRGA